MDSPEQRYDDLSDRVFTLYSEGEQRAALELLSRPDPELAPWSAELAHTAACLHGSLGEPEAALQVLRAASDSGAWWDPSILTDDDDLATLQPLPEFQELVALSATRRSPDPRPALIQLPPRADSAASVSPSTNPSADARLDMLASRSSDLSLAGGVVVALHGAGQTAARAAADWAEVLELGYALVCVESSQRMSPMYRTWPERDRAVEDIARALDELPDALRGLPLIAAGFSAGGRAALDWALTADPTPATGVLVVAPALRELPTEAAGPLAPAEVLIGEDDELLEVVDDAADRLTGFGLSIQRVPGVGHEFPQNFGRWLGEVFPSCG
ncbi:alpha/beta hydrolase [Kribbella monticola]|uniref:alpha/beta hydrolase n=1 Tax=Kribbella monticola TaxID=2185285 RepID=UPI000DD31BF3|nr:alpha/beta hydrolase [Kribbella monticola]